MLENGEIVALSFTACPAEAPVMVGASLMEVAVTLEEKSQSASRSPTQKDIRKVIYI